MADSRKEVDNTQSYTSVMADKSWIYVQKKTFTNWINDKLKATEARVEDLQIDLKDGIALITLMQVLAPGKKMPGKHKKNPRMDVHKRENLTIVFQFMINVENIPLVNIGAMDIYQCNLKLILGLIWTLILRYQIAGPVVHEAPDKKSGKKTKEQKSAKKLLHHWINVVIPGCKVKNFSESWNNGLALSALVDYCKPGLISNHASLNPSNALENIKNAMEIAEKELGVPQVMHPEDMAVEKPDELSVMTYVSGYSHQDSAGQKSLLIWINIQMPHHQVNNLSSDWTDGKALGALTDVLSGGQFPEYEGMSSETPLENCKLVMHRAKEMLEIDLLATPEEFSSLSLNQLTRVAYLAQFQSCKPKSLIDYLKVNGKGVTGDIVNQETTFTVSAQIIPKWADIRANVSTATGKMIQVTKVFQDDKSVKFSYTPEEPGEFAIDIFMNDSPLPQLHATHIIPTFVNNCTASGDGLKTACVGKRAEFTVDCEQGGVGELQVIIQGPNNKLPAVIEKTKKQTFNVHCTPEEVDSHEIAISWGNEQIPESPFQCIVIDPSKCSAKGLTDATINVQQAFIVDTRNAGPGELSVKCRGPSGELPVEIKDLQNNLFECSYVPKEEGSHVIDIYWSDIPVADSPFTVNAIVPTYADKCTVFGDGLKRACVGKRAEFTVDCQQGGVGELQVIIQGPNNKLPAVIEKTKPQTFNVYYTPEEIDSHEIAISFGSEQISESPFKCTVIDPSKCSVSGGLTQAIVNTPHTFIVDTRNAGPGELSVKCRGPSGELPVEIKILQKESFECTYLPNEEGSHVIDIYWSDIPVPDSPFTVNAIVPTYADKCTASGDGLKRACVGERAEFTVDCKQGGVGELQVIIQGPNNKLPAVIEKTKPQTFNVYYTPEEIDSHEIAISFGSEQISESPFKCTVIDPSKCSVSGGLTQATVNTPHTFIVDTRNAGPGELSVKCRGPSGELPVEIKNLQKESFECSYLPKEEGSHVIDIYWSDIPIPDSPFTVNAIVPTYADKCTASGDGLKRACVGKRAEFTVDCEQGGVGELQVIIQGPNNKLPAVIEKTKPQTFNVYYTPEEIDSHEIAISFGSEQISESPFKCTVIDPSKCSVSGGLTQAIAIVNTPHTFIVDTRNAGPGELSVKCRGPSGELPVEIKNLQKESFECSYLPNEEGSHVIDINWSDIPVPDSPFTVNAIVPTYADKCTASGDGLKRACVGKRAEFIVDCEQGGVGELQVIIQGPNNKLPAVIEKTKPQTFNVYYTPEEIDSHEIAISFGSEQISESPFKCTVIDPSKCSVSGGLTQATVNTPHTFIVDTRNAGPGERSVKCRGPSGELPVEIKILQKESFECSYLPNEEGSHVIDIYWSDIPISDSPFTVNAIVPTYADKCTASGDGLKRACVGKRAEFTVDCEQGGMGELQVIIQGPNNKLPAVIEKTKPQTFNVYYTPEEIDSHEIAISFGSEQISESPFKCTVIDPSKCSVSGGLTQAIAIVNTPHTFIVDTRNAGPGELSVKCRGPSGELPVEIKNLQKESFECSYLPNEEGSHVIDINWSDIPVPDSPFTVNAIVPTYADKCTASGDGLKRACVGKRAEFIVDCEQGGVGELQVIIQGPNNKLPAVIEKTKPQTFNVYYTPEEIDSHEIAISFGSEQISESPFKCTVIDPSKCSVSGGLTQATVNTPHTFIVDTRNAGPGERSVKCRGPSGELPVEIKILQKESFECSYLPNEEGSHVIDIYWSDIPISDSPFTVNAIVPTYADKCTASGDGLKRACVGKRAEFTVDCEQGGMGELQVIIQGPNNKLPAVIEKTKPQTFNVYYTPEEINSHEIAISFGSEQISESPFKCTVIDPSKCSVSGGLTQAIVNTPHTFIVDTRNAGPGELSVKCRGPSGELPVEIKNLQKESFECSYLPNEEGSHVIDIYWSDIPISDSPFTVNAIVPTYADKCTASGDGLKRACVGKRAEFTVDCEQGGMGELQVIIQGPNNKLPAVIEKTKPQTFNVYYTPEEINSHEIAISFGSEQISESPFKCTVIDPSKCSVSGGLTQAIVNTPHTFIVDTRNAGPGELSVKCRGPSGELPVEIKNLQKESFECSYLPNEEGSHVIDINWSDIPVPDSPFTVNAIVPTYADKCTASGDGLKRACVGKRAEFTVDCEQGGVGELQVIIEGPNNKLPAVIEKSKPQTFSVYYTPEEIDSHEIAISFGSEQISESPFKCTVIDPSKCSVSGGLTQAIVNTPHTFIVDTRNAGPGEFSVKCRGPSGKLPVEIKNLQKESFECSYLPNEEGSHVIDINWSDIPIPDSPFTVNAIVPTYADKCTASGDGLKRACVGKRAEFTVDCEQGGVGELQVIIQGPNNKLPAVIEKTKPQTFNVYYTPEEVDSHEIAISFGSEQISESPFKCTVIDPTKCSVSGGLTQAIVNTPHTFIVDTRNAGPGELSVKCRGPSGELPVEIKILQQESFEYSYLPNEEGSHVIDINWSDIPVPDSPFTVNAIVPTYADKCTASGDGLKRACVGKRAEFTVDCEQGGVGELQVIIQGPNNKLPAVIEKTKPQTFNVYYTPEEIDSHEIAISFGSEQISESPFKCTVIDPSKCSVSGGLTQAIVNTPHTFIVDTRNAGPGELSVKCRGPSGELPVEIKILQQESFECSYLPNEEGSHVIDINWSDIPVPDSPFTVNAIVPTYADKCTASGDGLKRACVGKRAEFTVDCEQGGVGELQVIIQGPNNKLPAVIEKSKPQTFSVYYTPEEIDSHEIAISFGSEQISESPFKCTVIDPSKCSVSGGLTQAIVNTPHTFIVDTRNAGPGELSVKCRGPSGELPVEIKDAGNKLFHCTWIPKEIGAHDFDVTLSGHPIPTSPLQINAIIYAVPGKCSIDDLPRGDLYVNKTYTFTVNSEQPGYTCDLTVLPTTKESLESCEINGDHSSGVYAVQFVPAEAGELTMVVKCNGTNILSSPLSFNVIDLSKPIKEQCEFQVMQNVEESINMPAEFLESEMEPTLTDDIDEVKEMILEINEPLTLLIDLESDQIGRDITATVTGQNIEPFDVPVVRNPDNSITVRVSANEPDCYTIQVKIDGEPLPTGPFLVTFIEPIKIKTPSEMQTVTLEPKEERIVKVSYRYKRKMINAQVSLSVDSSMADAISTSIAVQEVGTAAPIPAAFSELAGGMYNVEFMTTNEREYMMAFKYRLKIVPTAQDKHYVLSVI